MSESYLEVELRYKVYDVQACLARLENHGVTVMRTEHLVDEWYMPRTIQSLEEQRAWFDDEKGIAWRIRQSEHDGAKKLDVTSKQLTSDSNHNSFHETTAEFDNYDQAVKAMDEREYRNWLIIDKTRYFLTSTNPDIENEKFELIIDQIAGLAEKIGIGACLEIEHKGTATREEALKNIEAIATMLGFTSEDQFEKSLTVVSMTELAFF
jgi:adenylate cyclase class IV